MRKLAVYPFTERISFMSRFSSLIVDFDDLLLISSQKSELICETPHGDKITTDWSSVAAEADAILLVQGIEDFEHYLNIIQAFQFKDIYIESELLGEFDFAGASVKINTLSKPSEIAPQTTAEKIFDIDIPVISIMSFGVESGKFNLQLLVREFFIRSGYNVLQYGTKKISPLFGFNSLPDFIFENISFSEKIIRLNHLIYKEAMAVNPDVIIIGAPGGIMPYNKYLNNYFGEIPLIIAKAFQIDINIISTYFIEDSPKRKEYFRSLRKLCIETFGCESTIFNFSNAYASFNREKNIPEYYLLGRDSVEQNLPKDDQIVFFNSIFGINENEALAHIEQLLKSSPEQI